MVSNKNTVIEKLKGYVSWTSQPPPLFGGLLFWADSVARLPRQISESAMALRLWELASKLANLATILDQI